MKVRFKAPSPAMAVACVALMVALGGTSYAALSLPKNSVGSKQLKAGAVTSAKIKNGTIARSDLAGATVSSLTGATGPAGPTGPTGPTGAAGSAVAYGSVDARVSGGIKSASGWTHVEHTATGIYCLTGFTATLHTVVVSVDASSPDLGATAQALIGAALCPAGTQVEVQTYNGAARANEPFDFTAN